MRYISAMSVGILSLMIIGCGNVPATDNSTNQPDISIAVTINEDAIVIDPSTVSNGKLTIDINNKTQDVRQVRIDGLDVNVVSLPIPANDGKQKLVLNMFDQKGKLIIASTTSDQKKRLEANITVK